jgi:hypothetical protein
MPITLTPCATPTPEIAWSFVPETNVIGYSLYARETGTTWWWLLAIVPLEPIDYDEDGTTDVMWCSGVNAPLPIQRYCGWCYPYQSYEFAVKAVNDLQYESIDYSNVIEICFPPLCVAPGPCD